MTPQEHAEIWKKAARVVSGMDTMKAEMQAMSQMMQSSGNSMSGMSGRSYSQEEMTANRAYSAAAAVLYKIATEYEAAANLTK
jgi:hypothetical protein